MAGRRARRSPICRAAPSGCSAFWTGKPNSRRSAAPCSPRSCAGTLQRAQSGDIARTVAFRLGLANKIFAERPDLVRRVWSDDSLPIPILSWAFEWLTARGEPPTATPKHALRFAQSAEPGLALLVVRAAITANVNIDWKAVARELQEARFNPVRGELLRIFARFPTNRAE